MLEVIELITSYQRLDACTGQYKHYILELIYIIDEEKTISISKYPPINDLVLNIS